MPAKSAKGLTICITKGGVTPTDLAPTAITQAKPAVVTCTTTNVQDGDIVIPKNTGMTSLDNKMFIVANKSATDLELLGSDTSKDGVFTTGGTEKLEHYQKTDMVCLCLASISITADTPGTVEVGTYCNPSASLPSAAASAGTLDFSGYVDITDPDYQELLKAVDDANQRFLRIMFPNNGFVVFPVTFSNITWDLPLEGAIGYSGSAVLGTNARHLF
jgi:hypothetical protein